MQVEVNVEEVGTFSLTFTKPIDETVIVCRDPRKLVNWLRTTDEGKDKLKVAQAMGKQLPSAVAGMLGTGEVE